MVKFGLVRCEFSTGLASWYRRCGRLTGRPSSCPAETARRTSCRPCCGLGALLQRLLSWETYRLPRGKAVRLLLGDDESRCSGLYKE